MGKAKIIFRPPWTCGRYHEQSQSALMYNLKTGYSFFFEEDSACVIGELLKTPIEHEVNVELISEALNIDKSSINEFFDELVAVGLLVLRNSNNVRELYQHSQGNQEIKEFNASEADHFNHISTSDAELEYAERTGSHVSEVLIEVTYSCSEKCIHCYNPGAHPKTTLFNTRGQYSKLTLEDYKRIINQLYDEGTFKITFSGGDPFSSPYIWEIIDYTYKKGIAFEVFTNGQNLLGKEDKLAMYFPIGIAMSIYADSSKIHDAITRVPGSFDKSIEVLRRLHALNIPLTIKCCLMRQNVKYYRGVVEIAKELDAEIQIDNRVFDSLDGNNNASTCLQLTPNQLNIVYQDKFCPMFVNTDMIKYNWKKRDLEKPACKAGINSMCITPEGNLIPCVCYHKVLGNLKASSLKDILSQKVVLSEALSCPVKEYEECGKHDYCDLCMLCPGLNFAEHGDIKKSSSTSCYFAKIRYRLYKALKSGQNPIGGKSIQQALHDLPETSIN